MSSNPPFLHKLKTVAFGEENKDPPKDLQPKAYVDSLNHWFSSARVATLAWVYFCTIYWALLVLIPCIINNNLRSKNYILWIFGMLGVSGTYYAVKAGHPADSPAGKPIVAFTVILMAGDWCTNAYLALRTDTNSNESADYILMFFHSIAMLGATLFFYNRAIKSGKRLAWFTLIIEWADLISMCIVIAVLHGEIGECRSNATCWAYFIILIIDIFLWFSPIMFGFAETERNIHIHICLLDIFTDLPLVCIILYDKGYTLHWIVFFDVIFKILLVLRSIVFHGIINLAFRYEELRVANKQYYDEKLRAEQHARQEQDDENQIR